jgi:peptidoglycan hydrolase-like amidase
VIDRGSYDLETEYLPAVVTCEDDGAGPEALRAQAIAARSVAYYAHATQGSICDGQACQVFSCGREPTEEARRAVRETSGMYLSFNGVLSYGFYVAGDADTSAPGCQGGPRSGTERWVTYNEGRGDLEIQQTRLGYVHQKRDPGFGQNRGCMSQWGARCLEDSMGYSTRDILTFYYGRDIEVLVAGRACSTPS